jgi:hypothetical protein
MKIHTLTIAYSIGVVCVSVGIAMMQGSVGPGLVSFGVGAVFYCVIVATKY